MRSLSPGRTPARRTRLASALTAAAGAALSAAALTACGGGGGGSSTTSTSLAPKTPDGHAATIGTANVSNLGSVLVDSTGRTIYEFAADANGKSACSGACAEAWPPVMAKGKPVAGKGLTASKLGTIARPGGGRQVTYAGHPLYLYQADTGDGQANGQGLNAFGGGWFVLAPSGAVNMTAVANQSSSNGY